MNVLFAAFLVANTLTELMAAASLIGGPQGIAAAGSGEQWAMHYGFAAFAIATASIWVWPRRTNREAVTAVLGVLMVFHTGLCLSLALAGDQAAGMVIHAVLAATAIALFTQRSRFCDG